MILVYQPQKEEIILELETHLAELLKKKELLHYGKAAHPQSLELWPLI